MRSVRKNKKYDSLNEYAYEQIKNSILSQKYRPGSIISELKVAESLNISRTPIKTALYQLAMDGYVKVLPNQGYLIKNYGIKEIIEITQAREALEAMVARIACEKINSSDIEYLRSLFPDTSRPFEQKDFVALHQNGEKLHSFLLKIANNEVIKQILEQLSNQIMQANAIASQFPERNEEAYYEHCEIVKALIEKNAPEVERLMRSHIANQRKLFIQQMLS